MQAFDLNRQMSTLRTSLSRQIANAVNGRLIFQVYSMPFTGDRGIEACVSSIVMNHPSFVSAKCAMKQKRTRCEQFLADMRRLVTWLRQIASIELPAPPLQSSFAVPGLRGAGKQHAELMPTWRAAILTGMR